ncbi:DUF72 domain-containing protein [Luedemannella helvata]|uniref:DUF72 domain-containing protein n=1 Tax=Luedemannella helvata TaxID=349315 RepID=A0ABP4WA50_9ACTN
MIYIGTSGWQYRSWRGRFYPGDLPVRLWLDHYAARFSTVEVNNAFYRLPDRRVFEAWREHTPADLVVAVKMSRYLTHIKRLREPAEPVERFFSRACALGPKLGPVLLQLPPNLRVAALEDLSTVLALCPRDVRVAVEPRHVSWWCPAAEEVLRGHGAALCWADRGSRPVTPLWRTAGFGYLRMHAGRASPAPRYGRTALASWLDRLVRAYDVGVSDVFVYFNNDHEAAAIADAVALAGLARRRGLPVARVPSGRSAGLAGTPAG